MNDLEARFEVLRLIAVERERQISLHGSECDRFENQGDGYWRSKAVVLMEEVGEVARAILEAQGANLLTELIQVAAVATAMAELYLEKFSESS